MPPRVDDDINMAYDIAIVPPPGDPFSYYVYAHSNIYPQNFQIIEFTPTVSGVHTLAFQRVENALPTGDVALGVAMLEVNQ